MQTKSSDVYSKKNEIYYIFVLLLPIFSALSSSRLTNYWISLQPNVTTPTYSEHFHFCIVFSSQSRVNFSKFCFLFSYLWNYTDGPMAYFGARCNCYTSEQQQFCLYVDYIRASHFNILWEITKTSEED